jgi:choline dehydrogenase
MLGGGSSMNGMIMACGTKNNYDTWASLSSNDWNFSTMQTYIKRLMTQTDAALTSGACATYNGISGPLSVGNFNADDFSIPLIRAASAELGYTELPDINCGQYNGLAQIRGSVKNGERRSAANAYLAPLRTSTNFWLMKKTVVNKVLTTRNSAGELVVTGVNVVTKEAGCSSFNLVATREVILSAGGYNSPRILLRSGIGRSEDLSPFGITQKLNLNVGKNLQDHSRTQFFIEIPNEGHKNDMFDLFNSTNYMATQAAAYLLNPRTGDFSHLGPWSWSPFYNLTTTDLNADPDVQWIFYRYYRSQYDIDVLMKDNFRFKPEYANQIVKINNECSLLYVELNLLNQQSRGTVKLRDTDPYSNPKINVNLFSDSDNIDRNTVVSAIFKLSEFLDTSAMRSAGAKLFRFDLPDCAETYGSANYWKNCYIPKFTGTQFHPSGTCKMGKTSDPDAVVDPMLKVIGINTRPFLRVADASIMPIITSSNTQCPCYAIGERTADFIIADNS